MEMQLCAAQLTNCDVLMLGEPTGNLDVDNIRWLEDRKLKAFKGVTGKTLTTFVEKYPEKEAYFELSNETMKFAFPEPGPLEGKPKIVDVNLTVSQVSRVAVIGANGAGKNTAVNVLVGKQLSTSGSIWKTAGLRLAFVAQHAFHHLEKHMQETPTQYIMWRFAGNDDKESIEFKSDELSVDEESAHSVKWGIDGVTGSVRSSTDPKGDAKKEKTFEYEVKWHFKPIEANVWVEKDILIKMSYKKLVEREDERQAAMAGIQTKLLMQPGVEKHPVDFGVDPESASHTQINQLSGGMKVNVVLAAAIWQKPHVLILDEPTNCLDREGLGALVLAINDYKGDVLIISHNTDFRDGSATEKWIMNRGMLRIENEFAKIGIDEKLFVGRKENTNDDVIEVMNGCICCTVRGDLVEALKRLYAQVKSFDAILIETTAMADPAPVAQTFFVDDDMKAMYRLDGIITVADAAHVEAHLDEGKPEGAVTESVEQLTFADKIILNKCDLLLSGNLKTEVPKEQDCLGVVPSAEKDEASSQVSRGTVNIAGDNDAPLVLEARANLPHQLLKGRPQGVFEHLGVFARANVGKGTRFPAVRRADHVHDDTTSSSPPNFLVSS